MTSIRQIAREIGVHPSTVLRRLRKGQDPHKGPAAGNASVSLNPRPRHACCNLAAQIAVRAAAGMGGHRIAADLGLRRPQAVYEIARRHGISLPGKTLDAPSLRKQIEDMRPAEALEIVLEAYEQVAGQHDERVMQLRMDGWTGQQAVILAALEARPICRREYLLDLLSHAAGSEVADKTLSVQIYHIRKRLKGQPVKISNIWGGGYCLEKEKDKT